MTTLDRHLKRFFRLKTDRGRQRWSALTSHRGLHKAISLDVIRLRRYCDAGFYPNTCSEILYTATFAENVEQLHFPGIISTPPTYSTTQNFALHCRYLIACFVFETGRFLEIDANSVLLT